MSLESISAPEYGHNAKTKNQESQESDSQRHGSYLSLSIDGKPRGGSGGTEAMSVVKAASSTSKDSPVPHIYHGAASRVRMQESSAAMMKETIDHPLALMSLTSFWIVLSIVR